MSQIGIRTKIGTSFDSVKKSTSDAFATLQQSHKKDKENRENQFLKKKKLVYAYLKA
jgi:hypothetical protein